MQNISFTHLAFPSSFRCVCVGSIRTIFLRQQQKSINISILLPILHFSFFFSIFSSYSPFFWVKNECYIDDWTFWYYFLTFPHNFCSIRPIIPWCLLYLNLLQRCLLCSIVVVAVVLHYPYHPYYNYRHSFITSLSRYLPPSPTFITLFDSFFLSAEWVKREYFFYLKCYCTNCHFNGRCLVMLKEYSQAQITILNALVAEYTYVFAHVRMNGR